MKTADSSKIGIELTNRQVLEVMNSLTDEELDQGFLVVGLAQGYDFVAYAGPIQEELKIGTIESNTVLGKIGRFVIALQDFDIE